MRQRRRALAHHTISKALKDEHMDRTGGPYSLHDVL